MTSFYLPPLKLRYRSLLALLIIIFVSLGVAYSAATPVFESPDESSHLTLVRYISVHRALPPRVLPPPRFTEAWYLGFHDPPLYYAPPLYYVGAALLTSWTQMADLPTQMIPNPYWALGFAPQSNTSPWNKNVFVYPATKTLAQSETVRAAYLLRLVSLGLGALTLVSACALARELWPDRPTLAVCAGVLVGLNPQFIASSSGVTNDSLLNALCGVFFVGALRYMRAGGAWTRWALLGALAGLGLLTKQTALLLLPLGGLAILWQTQALPNPWRKRLVDGSAFLGAALLVGGWWYAYNAIRYQDPFGLGPHYASQNPLHSFHEGYLLGILRSYWAAFGWELILVEPLIYFLVGLLFLLALLGIVAATQPGGVVWHAPSLTRRGLALLALAFAMNAAALAWWVRSTGALYGRLLFPTLPAVSVLAVWGLSQWARWAIMRKVFGVLVGGALLFAAVVPGRYLRPALASPRLPGGMPAAVQATNIVFENGLRMSGYALSGELKSGRDLDVTLYWYAPAAPSRRYQSWVQLGPLDPTQQVSNQDVGLGGTLYPSDLWASGDTVRQTYRLSIPASAPAPGLYWIRLGLREGATGIPLVTNPQSTMATLGPWRLLPALSPPSPACVTDFQIGSAIRLRGYTAVPPSEGTTSTLQVNLYWQAQQAPDADYTVFVHALDVGGQVLGQHDSPPRDGAYPTRWWLPGEVIVDQHTLTLNNSETRQAQIWVGMYDPATLVRLPAYAGGHPIANDIIPLTSLDLHSAAPIPCPPFP